MTGFPPNAVILVTPVITAIGCDDWGDGNPEERSQPPWACTSQQGRSSLPVTFGLAPGTQRSKGNTARPLDSRASSRMTARGRSAVRTKEGENDGGSGNPVIYDFLAAC